MLQGGLVIGDELYPHPQQYEKGASTSKDCGSHLAQAAEERGRVGRQDVKECAVSNSGRAECVDQVQELTLELSLATELLRTLQSPNQSRVAENVATD